MAGSNPSYQDIIAYRNSCAGTIGAASSEAAISHAYENIADNVKIASGNVEHGGDFGNIFEDDMHLLDPNLLGKKGADVA